METERESDRERLRLFEHRLRVKISVCLTPSIGLQMRYTLTLYSILAPAIGHKNMELVLGWYGLEQTNSSAFVNVCMYKRERMSEE